MSCLMQLISDAKMKIRMEKKCFDELCCVVEEKKGVVLDFERFECVNLYGIERLFV